MHPKEGEKAIDKKKLDPGVMTGREEKIKDVREYMT